MRSVASNFNTINYYFDHQVREYMVDLSHKAPTFIKQLKAAGIPIYGAYGRKPAQGRYVSILTNGITSPNVYWLKFSNGSIILNYNSFDSVDKLTTLEEKEQVIKEAEKFEPSLNWTTANKLISNKLGFFVEGQCSLTAIEAENYDFLEIAMKGGANAILKSFAKIELHLDYHQLYAFVMSHFSFPCGCPKLVNGYYPHEFAIYMIAPGTAQARLKPSGYPIIPSSVNNCMIGADGKEFDVGQELQYLSDVDLQLLYDNYEIIGNLEIVATLYYPNSFEGKKYFAPLVNQIYTRRKELKGQPGEYFYKTINEVLPGHFERTTYCGGFWLKDFKAGNTQAVNRYNPKVGIFITGYGRRMLNYLLHQFNKSKVIGFDTDCVFFEGTKNAIPQSVFDMFGEEAGQIHEDGYYRDVIHEASKRYYGKDYYTGQPFRKMAGETKSGFMWSWNPTIQEFELKEVKKNEKHR